MIHRCDQGIVGSTNSSAQLHVWLQRHTKSDEHFRVSELVKYGQKINVIVVTDIEVKRFKIRLHIARESTYLGSNCIVGGHTKWRLMGVYDPGTTLFDTSMRASQRARETSKVHKGKKVNLLIQWMKDVEGTDLISSRPWFWFWKGTRDQVLCHFQDVGYASQYPKSAIFSAQPHKVAASKPC